MEINDLVITVKYDKKSELWKAECRIKKGVNVDWYGVDPGRAVEDLFRKISDRYGEESGKCPF